jgi:hypothetical protein
LIWITKKSRTSVHFKNTFEVPDHKSLHYSSGRGLDTFVKFAKTTVDLKTAPPSTTSKSPKRQKMEEAMIRFIAIAAFALAVATTAQAMTLSPLHQSNGMIIQIREACGAGKHMVNGTCVRTAARRNAARCAVGMRTVGGRCVK